MKKIVSLLAVALLFGANWLSAELVNHEAIINPFFDNNNYKDWKFTGGWRNDGENSRIVFDLSAANSKGYDMATGQGIQLAKDPKLADNMNFSAKRSKLTGFMFDEAQPFLHVFGGEKKAGDPQYKLYFEVTVETRRGNFQAVSNEFTDFLGGAYNEGVALKPEFKWRSDEGKLGNPAETKEGGIPLDEIKSIIYRAVMCVDQPAGNKEPVFVTLDNLSLQYIVDVK